MLKPPAPYRLRVMQPSDVKDVMAIDKQSFPAPWKESAYLYELTGNKLASYQVLSVQAGDQPAKVVGYAGYWLMAEEMHISTIAVDPKWRGKGLGELLLLNLLFMAGDDQARLVTLEVRRSNNTAQSLYGKYQFNIVGDRPRYYQNTEDAILMTVEPIDDPYRSFLRKKKARLYERLQEKAQSTGVPEMKAK